MKLRNVIALIAIVGMASEAYGAEVLRRTEDTSSVAAPAATVDTKTVEVKALEVKPVDQKVGEVKPVEAKAVEVKAVEVKAVETKTIAPVATPVETKAAAEADALRKARESEEVHTESKIVEKLEKDRLTDEQKRAERLFDPKKAESTEAAAPVAPVAAPAPSVTIQKVEIVQPTLIQAEPVAPAVVAPVAKPAPIKTEAAGAVAVDEKPPVAPYRFYVGILGEVPQYNDSRVTTNFGVGGTVGVMINEDYAVEGSFIYSNYYVNSGNSSVYNFTSFGNLGRQEMDQYEVKATFKWYAFRSLLGESRFKPYIGASLAYIDREYSFSNNQTSQMYYGTNGTNTSQSTYSVNLGAVVGSDFAITPNFSIGAFFEYSTPVMSNTNNNDYNYNNGMNNNYYGTGYRPVRVDSWDMMTIGLNAKFTF